MRRIEVLEAVCARTARLPVVATCAATSRELAAVADRPNHLYLLDSMGLAPAVGIGVAMALARDADGDGRVVVLEGDGGLLMSLNTLATVGALRPAGLVMVLLDNRVYASTGDVPTLAEQVDLGAVAAACGLAVHPAEDPDTLTRALDTALGRPGPHLVHARIAPGNTAGVPLLLEDPVVLGRRFRDWLTARDRPGR